MALILLDRDGVINYDSDDYIKSPDEWLPIASSITAIAQLKQAGHRVVIVSNQSGVGRGYFSEDTLTAIHEKMQQTLAAENAELDGIYYCPHAPEANCSCRKPKPGLLQQALNDFQTSPADALLIGDSLRDLQAAAAIHIPSILVLTGKGDKTRQQNPEHYTPHQFANLLEATQHILHASGNK